MPCKERQLLFDTYSATVKVHNENLQKLCDVIGSIPHTEFLVLWKVVRYTGERCQEAQRLLLKHIEEHTC